MHFEQASEGPTRWVSRHAREIRARLDQGVRVRARVGAVQAAGETDSGHPICKSPFAGMGDSPIPTPFARPPFFIFIFICLQVLLSISSRAYVRNKQCAIRNKQYGMSEGSKGIVCSGPGGRGTSRVRWSCCTGRSTGSDSQASTRATSSDAARAANRMLRNDAPLAKWSPSSLLYPHSS